MKPRVADTIYFGAALVLLVLVRSIPGARKPNSAKFCRRFFRLDWGLIFVLGWLALIGLWGYQLWSI